MQRKLAHPLILLGLAKVLLANEDCDSSVGHCQGDNHSTEEEENKYKKELNVVDSGAVDKENGDLEEMRDESKLNGAAEQQDTAYREMFDKDGLFNRDLAKEYLDKEDYEQVFGIWGSIKSWYLNRGDYEQMLKEPPFTRPLSVPFLLRTSGFSQTSWLVYHLPNIKHRIIFLLLSF